MPRKARLKPQNVETVYHLCNRVAGDPKDLPFGDREKSRMVDLIQWLNRYYTLDILSFAIMSNHYHIILETKVLPPSNQEASRRYADFYGGKRKLDPKSERCTEIAKRLCDISWFARDFQQRFTTWYNRTRERRRRGSLWAGRFRSCIVEQGVSTWRCLKYVEMNPVRAEMVSKPADYRYSSWGIWNRTGRHPFAEDVNRRLLADGKLLPWFNSVDDLGNGLREALELTTDGDNAGASKVGIAATSAKGVTFHADLNRRCPYWSAGCVIGSKTFVLDTVAQGWGKQAVEKQRLKSAEGAEKTVLAYRSLRKSSL
jgi:REP element-mobilizing transposase RayT